PPQHGDSDGDKYEHQVRDEVNGFRKRFTHKFFSFLEQESFGKRAHRSLLKSFGLLAAGDADTLSGRYISVEDDLGCSVLKKRAQCACASLDFCSTRAPT